MSFCISVFENIFQMKKKVFNEENTIIVLTKSRFIRNWKIILLLKAWPQSGILMIYFSNLKIIDFEINTPCFLLSVLKKDFFLFFLTKFRILFLSIKDSKRRGFLRFYIFQKLQKHFANFSQCTSIFLHWFLVYDT